MSISGLDKILFIQMGGTIDKEYPKSIGGYAFEIDEPASKRVLDRLNLSHLATFVSLCRKDSQQITDTDREHLLEIVLSSKQKRIIITHGTDTMLQTSEYLNAKLSSVGKIVIITGSLRPECFKNSDAEFNLGCAVGAIQVVNEPGTYVAMNGTVCHCNQCERDTSTFHFVKRASNQLGIR